ncbi:MAG: hypothetical protein E6J77_16125 [Deltaproteobacteria bacterium]|nr:MAG: hypothetical protein E6J77_16125 [Deltaproteobacteria bacterium]
MRAGSACWATTWPTGRIWSDGRSSPARGARTDCSSRNFRAQLREVAAAVPLGGRALLRRCLECNRLLEEVPRERARDRVPPFVWATNERFLTCPSCGRLYWPATHYAHMRQELTTLGLLPESATS